MMKRKKINYFVLVYALIISVILALACDNSEKFAGESSFSNLEFDSITNVLVPHEIQMILITDVSD